MKRLLASIMLATLSWVCAPDGEAQVLTADSVCAVLDRLPLHDVEGIWQLTDDGATVVIWREDMQSTSTVTAYTMVLLNSADKARRPGTLLGRLTATAQPNTFDAHLYTSVDGAGKPSKQKRFTLKLEDSAHLSFTRVHSGLRVSPLVIFPSLLRRSVTVNSDRQRNLDGCLKIYPRVPIKGVPRYL